MSEQQLQRHFASKAETPAIATPTNFGAIQSGISQLLLRYINRETGAITVPGDRGVAFLMRPEIDLNKSFATIDKGPGYGPYRDYPPLCDIISYIEEAGPRSHVLTTPNGRSAVQTVMTLLDANSHIIIAPNDIYPGSRYLFDTLKRTTGLGVTYTDATPEALEKAFISGKTKMIFTEPLTNPLMKASDLDAITAFARRHSLISVADNTTTLLLAQPLARGFDVSCGSLTKCFSGSNRTQGGFVAVNAGRPDLAESLRFNRNYTTGAHLEWGAAGELVEQARDFPRRMAIHSDNAKIVAEHLARHPLVAKVHSPFLPGDPGYALARKQFGAVAAILTIELAGDAQDTQHFAEFFDQQATRNMDRLNNEPPRPDSDQCSTLIIDSFGFQETGLVISARQTRAFAGLTAEQLEPFGVKPGTVRVAVGRGDPEQITRDLDRGLNHMAAQRRLVPQILPFNRRPEV